MGGIVDGSRDVKIAGRTIVAIIMAIGASIAIVLLVVETMLHVGSITSQESTVISTTLGAIIGALAVFLGAHQANGGSNADQQGQGRMEIRETRQGVQEQGESGNANEGDQGERGTQGQA